MAQLESPHVVQDKLFKLYDELNRVWLVLEKKLTENHIPHPICYIYHSYSPDGRSPHAEVHDCLGIQKVKGQWRICHGTYDYSEPEPSVWTPITECSALVRVNVAKHIEGLEDAIAKASERFVPKVEKAIKQIHESLFKYASIQDLRDERMSLNGKLK